MKELLTEYCPICEQEFTVEWGINTDGWIVYCPHCGHKTFMCDMCKECNSKDACPGAQQQIENFNKLK